jgi:polysaccharide export outer membrane protein
MKHMKNLVCMILAGLFVAAAVGCTDADKAKWEDWTKTGENRVLDAGKAIAKPDEPRVTMILSNVSELDIASDLYANATRPTEEDYIYPDEDYVMGPTDVLDIGILDLNSEGYETNLRREVSDSGYVDLPQLKSRIRAEGLTQQELTREIEKAYSPHILRDPIISVTIAARRQQTFSLLGAVGRPGNYAIMRREMRLLEALALGGSLVQNKIPYIYVIRHAPAVRKSKVEADASQMTAPEAKAPAGGPATPKDAELKKIGELIGVPDVPISPAGVYFAAVADGQPAPAAPAAKPAVVTPASTAATKGRWVRRDGKWVRIQATDKVGVTVETPKTPVDETGKTPVVTVDPVAKKPVTPTRPKVTASDPFGWRTADKSDLVRVIAIDCEQLLQGEYRMNIVIRDNDVIRVPPLEIGEFYLMGEVNRPGVYSLTGRNITIKQAISAAGNLGPVAWPENSVLIRRIGKNQEQAIPLNIEKIIRGTDPDLYLKPNDIIEVGTNWKSTFMAVVRNAFRMTYGFGFIYDRNFAEGLDYPRPSSKRFTRW